MGPAAPHTLVMRYAPFVHNIRGVDVNDID